jgi:HK97 family phage major capsid protein
MSNYRPTILRGEIAELKAERATLRDKVDNDTTLSQSELDKIVERANELNGQIDHLTEYVHSIELLAAERKAAPTFHIGTSGGQETHSRARNLVDAEHQRGRLPDSAAQAVTELLTEGTPRDLDLAERWTLAAGDEHYRGAFAKLAQDPKRGHMLFTTEEANAYRAAEAINVELRSLTSGTGGTGAGHLIPLTLDTSVMLSSAGSINPIRELATVKTTMTNQYKGISSAGATSEWKTEEAQAADGSPTFVQQPIPLFLADCFVPWSYEVELSADNLLDELLDVMRDSIAQLLATAYTTGNGTTAPQGLITGLAGTASEINGTGSEALIAADLYALQNALPARFQRQRDLAEPHRHGQHRAAVRDDERRAQVPVDARDPGDPARQAVV